MNKESAIIKKQEMIPEFLERIQEVAQTLLSRTGYHAGMLISNWRTEGTYYTVDNYIEDAAFHEFLKAWRKKDYALICLVREDEEKYLLIEVWADRSGIRKLIPFKKEEEKVKIDGRERLMVLQYGDGK